MTRWMFASVATCSLVALGARAARAGEPASFEWSAPLSCPSREAMLQRFRREGQPPTSLDARVVVEQSGESLYRTRIDLVANHVWSERSFEAPSCEAIAEAVTVVLRAASANQPPTPAGSPVGTAAFAPPSAPPAQSPPATPPSRAPTGGEKSPGRGFSVRAALAADADTRIDATPGFGIGVAWRAAHWGLAADFNAFAPSRASAPSHPAQVVGPGGPGLVVAPGGTAICPPSAPCVVAPNGDIAVPVESHEWLLRGSLQGCVSGPLRRLAFLVEACLGAAVETPPFTGSDGIAVVPTGDVAAEWWATELLGLRASARWLLDIPRTTPWSALVAFEPSLGVVLHLGK